MGLIFKIPSRIILYIGMSWGLLICLDIAVENSGFIGGLIAFFLLPFTFMVIPWHEAIANSNWFLMVLIYGTGIGAPTLYRIGSIIDGD